MFQFMNKNMFWHVYWHMFTKCSNQKSKFDFPILFSSIVQFCEEDHRNIKLLKKGSKLTYVNISEALEDDSLNYDLIQFRDVLSYTSPCSLDKFLRQWKTPQVKGCFPHG